MRNIKNILLTICMLCATIVYAQNAKYQGEIDFGYSSAGGNWATNRINLHTIHGARINNYISIGAGIGLDYYYEGDGTGFILPLYGNVKGYVPINEKWNPYASLGVGYGFGILGLSDVGGLYWDFAIGVKYRLLKFQIGYVSQSFPGIPENINLKAVQFRIGLAF